ncbi:MAG TPA: CPBP family intramembrane glutamic endopeptidase [Planctomycetota bacterium]|nr:CPBP family intramembrane glutamic endopeptidase [Planctomycetota bacterium]
MNPLGPLAALFVVVVGVGLPVLAWRSRHAFAPDRAGPPVTPRDLYVSTVAVQVVTLLLALWVAHDVGMPLLGGEFRVEPLVWAATAAVLGGLLATLPGRWRTRSPESRRRQALMAPRTPRQAALNVGLCLLAGIGEELVYRGVLHGCLWWATGSWWLASAACAVSFGVAHAIQGLRSMLIVAGVAVWLHATVRWTGSLHLAMVAHVVYDLIATFTLARWVKRDELAAG